MHASPGLYSFQPHRRDRCRHCSRCRCCSVAGEGSARGARCENGVISRCGRVYCWEYKYTTIPANAHTRQISAVFRGFPLRLSVALHMGGKGKEATASAGRP